MTTLHILKGSITDVSATPVVPMGTKYIDENGGNEKRYRYCYNAGADEITADDVVSVFLTTPLMGEVSITDATQTVSSDATTTVAVVAGIALATVATTYYGWMQVGGYCDTGITTDDSIEVGDQMYCADNAHVATSVEAAHQGNLSFGWSPIADGGTTLTAAFISTVFDF